MLSRLLFTMFLSLCVTGVRGQDTLVRREVLFTTSMGDIRIALYDETPLHRDNMLRLVEEGFYDGLLFHRVMYGFMIQTGDPDSRDAEAGQVLGMHSQGEKIAAEIKFPELYHRRGCVAAARQDDSVNPERMSSGSQFYIVWGKRMNAQMLDAVQERLDIATGGSVVLTPEQRMAYYQYGGTPHLDGQYTVFGEVVDGLSVVDSIQRVPVDGYSRPVDDVRIIRAVVVR